MTAESRTLWRAAGWLLVGYVVITFAGSAFQQNLSVGASADDAQRVLVTSSLASAYTGMFLELVAGLVFLVGALLLAQLLRGDSEIGRWLSACVSGGAVVYVAVQLATSAAGAAALYEGHHGAPLVTVTTLNDMRGVGFAVSGAVAGALVLAASAAALRTGLLPRWFAYAGVVVALVCIATTPAVKVGAVQTLLWFLWLLMAGLLAIRSPRRLAAAAPGPLQPAAPTA